ncbi:MAG: hypothetical protein R3E50_14315 [Halioglobus sp.]
MSDTLYDAYRRFLADAGTPFTTPGHKRNPELCDELLALDVPHYGGVEDRRVSTRRLAAAEKLAGELFVGRALVRLRYRALHMAMKLSR